MIRKVKDNAAIFGLAISILSAAFVLVLGVRFFYEPRLIESLFDVGIDALGALLCTALYFGCMKQRGIGIGALRSLIVMVSVCFAVNLAIHYTVMVPEYKTICFVLCLASKLIDLVMIYFFYTYVKVTLAFKGKLARPAEIIIPVLLVIETIVILSNIFYPTTFYLDEAGAYFKTAFSWGEDVYLAVTSLLTGALIIMSHNPRSQKIAALTFILFPLVEYAIWEAEFANSAQYGTVLMSLVIMYCVIFIDRSKTLASTQTDLAIASKIQTDALPPGIPDFPDFPEVILRGSMNTAKEVGGDFYDYFLIDENRICFLIADVSGKGTPAALFMMTAKTMIKDYALTKDSTAEIFNAVNQRLCENNDEGMFATAWIGIFDKRTNTLQYTNAGHNYPILQRKGRPCEELEKVHGLFLAGMDFTVYKQDEIALDPGDRLLLYTDGVTEAHDRDNNLYGTERLEDILNRDKDTPGEKLLGSILSDIRLYAEGVPQFDDITMVVLTIKE